MSLARELNGLSVGLVAEFAGGDTTGTYAQGTNSKTLTTMIRQKRSAARDSGGGLDREFGHLTLAAEFFSTGFSGANPVAPSSGDTFTVAGEVLWTVDRVEPHGLGAGYGLDVSRRRQKGAS